MSHLLVKTFNRSIFQKTLRFVAIRIPCNKCQEYRKRLENYLLCFPRLKNIVEDEEDRNKRLLLLDESISDPNLSQLPKALSDWILSQRDVSVVHINKQIDYKYYTAYEVLSQLLPDDVEVPTSFEQVGHLIHLNLHDDQLPYKYLIGEVLLDKTPSCRTVVNKIGKIDSVFRTFDMEIIAGEDDTNVTVNEGASQFQFDYRKVYWNSRLHHEHIRLVNSFHQNDIVADMFCGVGPFVIPAARKGCICYANDLNPSCIQYLKRNIELNHLSSSVLTSNLDGRSFIQGLFNQHIPLTQIIMNLPASAELFCDVFSNRVADAISTSPTVHCYMFSNQNDPIQDSIHRIEEVMKRPISKNEVEGRIIRDVAPRKVMTLVSFKPFS